MDCPQGGASERDLESAYLGEFEAFFETALEHKTGEKMGAF